MDQHWFTETAADIGSAFSLQITATLHSEDSAYQRIEVFETTGFGRLLTLDGCIMLSDRDNFIYHEMLAHPALCAHPGARDVAIIGGGDCGTLREVLKHPQVTSATQVELDAAVTRVCERYFPALCSSNNDPRARLLFDDGIAWMHAAEPGNLDVILIDSTDPVGPAAGLFSAAFYAACHRALRPGGLLVAQSESPLVHGELIASMHAALHAAGFAAAHLLSFPLPVYPTGWWSATLAQRDPDTLPAPQLPQGLETDYYTTAIHHAALAQPAFMQRRLAHTGAMP